MVAKLLTFEKLEENRVGLPTFPTVTGESQLWDFVREESLQLFIILKVLVDWLTWPPVKWEESEIFRKIEKFITTAKVINNMAERAIKLASDYAQYLAKDSEMRQKLSSQWSCTGGRRLGGQRRALQTNDFTKIFMI